MIPAFRHLSPVAPDKLARVLQAWPDVPDDYLLFLAEYGAGSMADDCLVLYGGLIAPQEIYGDAHGIEPLLLLGDDLQGLCIAFDTRDATVVEVDPTNRHVERVADTFTEFIHAYQQEPD